MWIYYMWMMIKQHKVTWTICWTILEEIINFIRNGNTLKIIYKIQTHDSEISIRFCTGFLNFVSKGKSLLNYGKFFSPNEYEKNDKIILKYFE